MPSYKLYKMIHLAGVVLVCMSIAGISFHAWLGGTKEAAGALRKRLMMGHGVGLFLAILGGMGAGTAMGAISSEAGFPGWIWLKMGVWVLFGALPALPYRSPKLAASMFVVVPLLIMLAAWIAGGFQPLTR